MKRSHSRMNVNAFEQRYLAIVKDAFATVYTEGVDQITANLSQVFVMPEAIETRSFDIRVDLQLTREQAAEMGLKERPPLRGAPTDQTNVSQARVKPARLPIRLPLAFHEHQYLLLLGDAGAGKTTALKFMALCFADGKLAQEKFDAHELLVPVFIELRSYQNEIPLRDYIISLVSRFTAMPSSDPVILTSVDRWLSEGRMLLLLDGLDEVLETQRAATVEQIRRFVASHKDKRMRVVVTSRTSGYLRAQEFGEGFAIYALKPLGASRDKENYVSGWLKSIAGRENAGNEAAELIKAMEQQGSLRRIIGSPLLLRLALRFYYDHGGRLAENRAVLYRSYVEDVLKVREQKKQADDSRWSDHEVEKALEVIAWALQSDPYTTQDRLKDKLRSELDDVNGAADLLAYLRERLGLLATYGHNRGDLVAFRHLTFREFFAAQRLANEWRSNTEGTWMFLKPRLHHPAWQEPIELLAGQLADATDLVRRIADARSAYERELYRDLLLAGKCIANSTKTAPDLKLEILNKLLGIYLEENKYGTLSWMVPERLFSAEIEALTENLGVEDQRHLASALLATATGTETEHSLHARFSRKLEIVQGAWSSVTSIRDVLRFPVALRQEQSLAARLRRRVALKALGDLSLWSPEVERELLGALNDGSTAGIALEALAKNTFGKGAVISTVLVRLPSLLKDGELWRQHEGYVEDALANLGQRYSDIADSYMRLALSSAKHGDTSFQRRLGRVICRVAETNPQATDYVLQAWQERSNEIHYAILDVTEKFQCPSGEVIRHLIDVWGTDAAWRSDAENLLQAAIGGTPDTRCKAVNADCRLSYKTVDLTEDIFNLFLVQLGKHGLGLVAARNALGILVRWGLNKPDLLIRLLGLIKEADPWLLAAILRTRFNGTWDQLGASANETIRAAREVSLGRLTNPDATIRQSELRRYLFFSQCTSPYNPYRTLRRDLWILKCQLLNDALSKAGWVFYQTYEASSHRYEDHLDPYAYAALACFRAWGTRLADLDRYGIDAEEIESECSLGLNVALSILREHPADSINLLSGVLSGECPRFWNARLEAKLGGDEDAADGNTNRSVTEWTLRIAAAHALANLTNDYPEAQTKLIICLRREIFLKHSRDDWPEDDIQAHIVQAMGTIKGASALTVAALLNLAETDWRANYAMHNLPQPSPEAVSLMIEWFGRMREAQREEILRSLATLPEAPAGVIDLFVDVLDKPTLPTYPVAAEFFGSPKILESLSAPIADRVMQSLAHNTGRTVKAANALVNLADRASNRNRSVELQLLERGAHELQKGIRQRFRVLPDEGTYEDKLQALKRVLMKASELKVSELPATIPVSQKTELPKRTRWDTGIDIAARVLVPSFSGLLSNIIASYIQERFGLITDEGRFAIVVVVFAITLTVEVLRDLRIRERV